MFAFGAIPSNYNVSVAGKLGAYWYAVYPNSSADQSVVFQSVDPVNGHQYPSAFVVTITPTGFMLGYGGKYLTPTGILVPTPTVLTVTPVGYNLPPGLWAGIPVTGISFNAQPLLPAASRPAGVFGGVGSPTPNTTISTVYFIPIFMAHPQGNIGPFQGSGTTTCTPLGLIGIYGAMSTWMKHGVAPCATFDGCIFVSPTDCARGKTPQYCLTGDDCGKCLGACSQYGGTCTYDATATTAETYTCAGARTPPDVKFWDTYKYYIIAGIVILVLLIIIVIVVVAMRPRPASGRGPRTEV